jgi:hypothetical protein
VPEFRGFATQSQEAAPHSERGIFCFGICNSVATDSMRISELQRASRLDALAETGVRLTAQRRAFVEVFQESREHLDAATLLEKARERQPNIDRATAYQTVELLRKLRLIDELDHASGV